MPELKQPISHYFNQTNGARFADFAGYMGEFLIIISLIMLEGYGFMGVVLIIIYGTIILIRGNHDKIIKEFIVVKDSLRIGNFIFSHRPILKKEIPKGFVNVHGHVHEKESLDGINLSVEHTDYEPVLLEEVEREINMKRDKKSEMSENKIK